MKLRYLLPLFLFLLLAGLLAYGLQLNPREIPSPLIDKPAPAFALPRLHQPEQLFSPESMRGQPWVLNVWASWCGPCRDEHPLLTALAKRELLPIIGLNYKERPDEAIAWLQRYGDPYAVSVLDQDGQIGIDYGVYGVPETYLIDRNNIIRFKHIGPINRRIVDEVLLPKIQELLSER